MTHIFTILTDTEQPHDVLTEFGGHETWPTMDQAFDRRHCWRSDPAVTIAHDRDPEGSRARGELHVVPTDSPRILIADEVFGPLLRTLGYPIGQGEDDDDTFTASIRMASVLHLEDEDVSPHVQGGVLVRTGRHAGTLAKRYEELLRLADCARDRQMPVIWT